MIFVDHFLNATYIILQVCINTYGNVRIRVCQPRQQGYLMAPVP